VFYFGKYSQGVDRWRLFTTSFQVVTRIRPFLYKGTVSGFLNGRKPNFQVRENSMLKMTATGLMLVALTGITGCATTSDLDALRAEVQQSNEAASQAAADAASARTDAAAARAAAEEARNTAQETNEKLDRMFKKSMYK
jgi:murein lipoprotein